MEMNFNFFSGLFLGFMWGAINLYFIGQLLHSLLIESPKKFFKMGFLILLKFPMIYFSGYLLLAYTNASPLSLTLGFILALNVYTLITLYRNAASLHSKGVP